MMKLPFNVEMPRTEEEKRVTVLFLISLVVLALIILFLVFFEHIRNFSPVAEEATEQKGEKIVQDPFESIEIEAKAAYVFDATTGEVLYSKNAQTQLPLASITKLMTAIIAAERSSLDERIVIDERALLASGDDGLLPSDVWTLRDLLSFTLAVSSNDGAAAIAHGVSSPSAQGVEVDFIEYMNKKAKEVGLAQTYFLNPTGLDASDYTSGGYGSAEDAAKLLLYAIAVAGEVLEATTNMETVFTTFSEVPYTAVNTNQFVDKIPGLIASKTGFTDLAGGNLVIAFDAGFNHPIIIAVLGSSLEGRFRDTEKLVDMSLQKLSLQ